ncbi:MAG: thaumatin family protein [Candidatus Binatus sp.]|uniref:thaumatin family protein n=1 Tax=Candidatus Binatus sp. TaxID=2811406 RepID=UPI002720869A|nr:thaumatin family protein [Candidatus Binatus sp.]MDO8430828.1 thaumatin family protein [Candidatus Binatus sp.]
MSYSIVSVALLAMAFGWAIQLAGPSSARADELTEVANRSLNEPGIFSTAEPSVQAEVAGQPQRRLKGAPPDPCLKNLPVPVPQGGAHRVIQLVNCSSQTMLGAANAAARFGTPLTPVLPREKTWVLKPAGSPNNANVLTIDIPPQWENTKPEGSVGPRLWARTGCRYDVASDRAQCETGGCGGKYDCSKAKLGASVGTTVSEWTFYEPVESGDHKIKYFKDSPDISAVDGVNLNMDIQPLGGSPKDPFDAQGGHDIGWLAENYPLSQHGKDLRAAGKCDPDFRLKRSDLTTGLYAFVIVANDRKPKGGDGTVACFSNCARYAYPTPPDKSCDASDRDSKCYKWKAFCLGDPTQYGQKCTKDSDCPVAGSCWDNPGSKLDHTCQGRAFIKKNTCPEKVCTFPYNYRDPVNGTVFKSTQPPFGNCDDVSTDKRDCIGDDTIHEVLPKAYSWPNDPQVYGGDAKAYRVIIAPGGTNIPITPLAPIPVCSTLPGIYDYSKWYGGAGKCINGNTDCHPCDIELNKNGAVFGVARPRPDSWSCNLPPAASGNDGVICKWK